MAGYNRGIVATRKLNKNNKAKLGRRGDTKIREVDNRASHVNALEAYLIDVNGKAGEEYAKRVGAGTVNPLTGMPEYSTHSDEYMEPWQTTHQGHDEIIIDGNYYEWNTSLNKYWKLEGSSGSVQDNIASYVSITSPTGGEIDPNAPDPYSYEGLKDVTGAQLTEFDPTLGAGDEKYFQDIFSDKPFDFLGDQQELTTGRAGDVKGFTERGLQSAYGSTMGALGSQQEALSMGTGRGFREAGKSRDIATSRSGLATSGTITQGYETQKKDLFQDYAAGTKDIGRQRGTALETLTLGKDVAGADYDYSVAGAGLDFAKGTYAEQQRQMDEYWEMIGLRQAAGS